MESISSKFMVSINTIIANKKLLKLAIECVKKQRKAIAWDGNMAKKFNKPPDYFARRLEQYNELGRAIECLEGLLEHD